MDQLKGELNRRFIYMYPIILNICQFTFYNEQQYLILIFRDRYTHKAGLEVRFYLTEAAYVEELLFCIHVLSLGIILGDESGTRHAGHLLRL